MKKEQTQAQKSWYQVDYVHSDGGLTTSTQGNLRHGGEQLTNLGGKLL